MKSKNTETHDVYVGEVVDPTPPRHGLSAFLVNRSARAMMDDAIYTAGRNRCRALIVKSAMEEAGALAMAAGHLAQIAPQGSEVYQDLLRVYGEKAVQSVERW